MRRQIRINDRADADLMALHEAGYSLGAILRDVLASKKNSQNLFVYVSKTPGKPVARSARINISIPEEIIPEGISARSFSGFCKTVLRTAVFPLPLSPFISAQMEEPALEDVASAIGAIPAERYQTGFVRPRLLFSPSPPEKAGEAPKKAEKTEQAPPARNGKPAPKIPEKPVEQRKETKTGSNDLLAMFDAL